MVDAKKTCVINFSDQRFIIGQNRLKESLLKIGFEGGILFWNGELPPNSPTHNESPWAFKVFAFEAAFKAGFEHVIWIDSSGIAIRSLDNLFRKTMKDGYYLSGNLISKVGNWCSDIVMRKYGYTRDELMQVPEISAFCIGISIQNKTGKEFFDRWKNASIDGISFRGLPLEFSLEETTSNIGHSVSADQRVLGHRHDQTIASILAHQLNMKISPFECYDIIGHAKPGEAYSRLIPLSTVIVQNRDFKNSQSPLRSLDKFANIKSTLGKSLFLLKSLIYTIIRNIILTARILRNAFNNNPKL